MKIKSVQYNNRKKAFEVASGKGTHTFPYSKADPQPVQGNYVRDVYVDRELGNEGFTYILESGEEGSVHLDSVLEYNQEPEYMSELLLYNLTIAVRNRLSENPVSKREIIRRLNTSATQLYRLLDPANPRKSMTQLLTILHLLDCDVELTVRDKAGNPVMECIA